MTLLAIVAIILIWFMLRQFFRGPKGLVQGFRAGLAGDSFPIPTGKYVAGLPDFTEPTTDTRCSHDGNNFIFQTASGKEIGRIATDSINQILAEDKSRIEARITVPRVLMVGIFALGLKKHSKVAEWCMVIDWDSASEDRQNTVFEFSGKYCEVSVNKAANLLRKTVKPKLARLRPDEKRCPSCAEVVKAEARLCRFCQTVL